MFWLFAKVNTHHEISRDCILYQWWKSMYGNTYFMYPLAYPTLKYDFFFQQRIWVLHLNQDAEEISLWRISKSLRSWFLMSEEISLPVSNNGSNSRASGYFQIYRNQYSEGSVYSAIATNCVNITLQYVCVNHNYVNIWDKIGTSTPVQRTNL